MTLTHININPELLIKLVASKLRMWVEAYPQDTFHPQGNLLLPWEGLGGETTIQESRYTIFCSGIFPASGYLFSAPRGLKKSIISTTFCSLSSRYLEHLRRQSKFPCFKVITSTCAGGQHIGGFREIAIDIKNNVIRQ